MDGVKGKLLRGSLWLGVSRVFVNLLAIASAIILAKLLVPEDFGLVAIVISISAIMSAITNLALSQALIHQDGPIEADFNTAWSLAAIRGAVLAGFLLIIAKPITQAYSDERLLPLVFAIAALTFLASFENPKFVSFERRLEFRQSFFLEGSEKIVSFVCVLAAALYFQNYWALIIGTAAAQLTRVAMTYFLIPFRPKFELSRWRQLMSFSVWLTGASFVKALNQRSTPLLIGAFLPSSSVGQFSLAHRVAELPLQEAKGALQKALFPAFARMRNQPKRLFEAYLKAQALSSFFVLAAGIGFAVLAEDVVITLLSEKWLPAVPIMQALAFAVGLLSLQNARPVVLGLGNPKAIMIRDLCSFAFRLPAILIGLMLGGLMGLALGLAISAIFNLVVNISLLKKVADFSIKRQLSVGVRPGLAAVVMVLVIWTVRSSGLGIWAEDPNLISLFSTAIVGSAAYLITAFGLWTLFAGNEGAETEIIAIIKSLLSYRQKPNRT